jgi:hypothetical protein
MKMKMRFPKVLMWGSIAFLLFAFAGCSLPTDSVPEPPDREDTEASREQDSGDDTENEPGNEDEGKDSGDSQDDPGDRADQGDDEDPEDDDDEGPEDEDDQDDNGENADGAIPASGALAIQIGEMVKAEGVYPEFSGVTRYLLDFFAEDGRTAERLSLETGEELTVSLDAGDWEIRAYGVIERGDGQPPLAVISGTARVTVRENGTETVLIVPDGPAAESGAQGFLSWNINYPGENTWEAVLIVSLKIDGEYFVPYRSFDLTVPGAKGQTIPLPPGTYRVESRFFSHHANSGTTETVHIFPGLETGSSPVTITGDTFPAAEEFSSVEELEAGLAELPENNADTPYPVKIAGVDLSSKVKTGETLKTLYDALTRYVTLDLRECTGTELIAASTAALEGRKKIVSLILPDSITGIAANGFSGYESLQSAFLPKVTTINYAAFNNLGNLATVSAPELTDLVDAANTTTTASRGHFYRCAALTSIYFPKLEAIDHHAFYECTGLTAVWLPQVTGIGNSVFTECTSLKTAVLPDAVSIGSRAFYNDKSLENLVLGPVPPELTGSSHFPGGFPQKIWVPASAIEDYNNSAAWSGMQDRMYPVTG